MSELNINNQSLPSRCEICHQSDSFNALDGSCRRCTQIQLPSVTDESSRSSQEKFTINVQLRFRDFLRSNWEVLIRRWYFPIMLVINISFITYILSDIAYIFVKIGPIETILLLFFLVVTPSLAIPLILLLDSYTKYVSMKYTGYKFRLNLDQTGVDLSRDKLHLHFDWQCLSIIEETKSSLRLHINQTFFVLVPKQALISEDKFRLLTELISIKLMRKARLIKNVSYLKPIYLITFFVYLVLMAPFINDGLDSHFRAIKYQQRNNLLNDADTFYAEKNYAAAEECYLKIMSPIMDPYYLTKIGDCRLAKQDLIGAKLSYEAALMQKPSYTEALEGLIQIAVQQQNFSLTEEYCRRFLILNGFPINTKVRYNLARALWEQHKYLDAQFQFKLIVELNPDSEEGIKASYYLADLSTKVK